MMPDGTACERANDAMMASHVPNGLNSAPLSPPVNGAKSLEQQQGFASSCQEASRRTFCAPPERKPSRIATARVMENSRARGSKALGLPRIM